MRAQTPAKKGLFGILGRRGGESSEEEEDNDDEGRIGWFYRDDFGREQGPFSTERMRAWMRKGYLTNEREARRTTDPPEDEYFKPLWAFAELDVLGAATQARKRWQKTKSIISIARGGLTAKREFAPQLEEMGGAAQQRYARSPFSFDNLLLRIPFFRNTPPDQWPPDLLDALVLIVELATVDTLSHVVGHYDGSNLGVELLMELLALGFWYMKPPAKLENGLSQALYSRSIWRSRANGASSCSGLPSAAPRRGKGYWELTRLVLQCSADYAHALQFIDWSPTDAAGSQALAEYLHHQLQLAGSLEGEAQPITAALTFTIEQLRLPMLPQRLSSSRCTRCTIGVALR